MLQERIENKDIEVSVVGLGYVGLPLAILCANAGMKTHGIDISKPRVEQLAAGSSYVDDVRDEEVAAVVGNTFLPTIDPSVIAQSQVVVLCVPTPLTKHKEPDVSYIQAAGITVGKHLQAGSLVILESTTYPGTTEEILLPILEKESGLVAGKDFFLAFAPERVDPGNKNFEFHQVPKVVGGLNPEHTEVACTFYKHILDAVHPVSSTRVAEMTKLLENIYRLVNISMINEMALLAGKMNIDIHEVIDAAKTKPYGFQAFYPGPGAGGHCIPLDPFYLAWKAKEHDFTARFIGLAGDVNYRMPEYALSKIMYALNTQQKAMNGAKVLVLGVAYKPNIADPRESPILRLLELIIKKKSDVVYYDPYISTVQLEDTAHTTLDGLASFSPADAANYDCVVVGTDHDALDYEAIAKAAPLVVDLRNAVKDRSHPHVYRF